eukprot:1066559-Pelagomonas_calceolata.AAC.2
MHICLFWPCAVTARTGKKFTHFESAQWCSSRMRLKSTSGHFHSTLAWLSLYSPPLWAATSLQQPPSQQQQQGKARASRGAEGKKVVAAYAAHEDAALGRWDAAQCERSENTSSKVPNAAMMSNEFTCMPGT